MNGFRFLQWMFAWGWLTVVLIAVDGFETTMERWFK